jgi:hypothetical protein
MVRKFTPEFKLEAVRLIKDRIIHSRLDGGRLAVCGRCHRPFLPACGGAPQMIAQINNDTSEQFQGRMAETASYSDESISLTAWQVVFTKRTGYRRDNHG